MQLSINGQARELDTLHATSTIADLVTVLAMQADRVAPEQNGLIVSRAAWAETRVEAGDRFEIVHFVGGGSRRVSPHIPSGDAITSLGVDLGIAVRSDEEERIGMA